MQPIRNNSRLQPSSKQAQPAIRRNDVLSRSNITNLDLVHLPVCLYDAQRVGARVGDDRGAEADEGLTEEFLEEVVRLWEVVGKVVVGAEPGIMAYERCCGGCKGAVPETSNAVDFDL